MSVLGTCVPVSLGSGYVVVIMFSESQAPDSSSITMAGLPVGFSLF